MSAYHTFSLPAGLPATPLVISVDGVAAGVAIRGSRQFRFFSGDPRFDLLDGSRFTRVEDLRGAVKRLASAVAETAQPAIREGALDVLVL